MNAPPPRDVAAELARVLAFTSVPIGVVAYANVSPTTGERAAMILAGLSLLLSLVYLAQRVGQATHAAAKVGLIVGVFSLLAVYIAGGVLQRMRMSAGRVECASHLRQIGQAMRQYEVDHGVVPPDLNTISAVFWATPDVLVCPDDPNISPGPGPRQLGWNTSYVYLPSEPLGPNVLAGYCASGRHNDGDGGTYVLLGDGSVRYAFGNEVRRLLAGEPSTRPR